MTTLVLEVFRANGALLAAGDTLVADLGLTSARWQVLGAIASAPTPLPVAHLGRTMGLTRQAVQRTVDDLRKEGFVALQPNPHHRRAMLVVMSAKGENAYRIADGRQALWADRLLQGVEPADLETAVRALQQLQRRLEAGAIDDTSIARKPEMSNPKFVEMDHTVTLAEQLGDEGGAVVLVNTFVVPPGAIDAFLEIWGKDAAVMKKQPGFLSTQLHRGIAGSGVFLNYAIWESVALFRAAFANPEFRASIAAYPEGVSASPHLFRTVAVPGICAA